MKEKINCLVLGVGLNGAGKAQNNESPINFIYPKDGETIYDMLNENRTVDSIISIGDTPYVNELNACNFEIRKKWVHFKDADEKLIENTAIATFIGNINRNTDQPLFSIFTSTYKSKPEYICRLYNSLLKQTYPNWNWWIIDDTPDENTCAALSAVIDDPRVTIIKNVTNHANIGFNKHLIAMSCDGDYLVEVDHDDEITEDCLMALLSAFRKFPEAKFAYSDTLELVDDHTSVRYPAGFSYGQGHYKNEVVNGWLYKVAITSPSINAKSARGIHAQPNHVRCWEKNFYHEINGHNINIGVCDDMELFTRTFLKTRVVHINKVLYIQHEEGGRRESNTQGKRYLTIQALNYLLMEKYDKMVHDRIIELGFNDTIWDEETQHGDVFIDAPIEDYGFQYYPDVANPQ